MAADHTIDPFVVTELNAGIEVSLALRQVPDSSQFYSLGSSGGADNTRRPVAGIIFPRAFC